MKVLHSIWSLASENGGPTRSTIGLCKALAKKQVSVTLVSNAPGSMSLDKVQNLADCGVRFLEGNGTGFFTALRDSKRFLRDEQPDIVHVQGLWKLCTHAMVMAAHQMRIPVVISPRGMLDPWALSVKRLKKRFGLWLYQQRDLQQAAAFHATSQEEADHIRALGFLQPIILDPNGVDLPPVLINRPPHAAGSERKALFLSRLHPGKGLMLLAEAWAALHPPGWKMVIVGPDVMGHQAEVQAKLSILGVEKDWCFLGEKNDQEKWGAFFDADLFIHPSESENFGISIAEALASGLPVITTKGCPWAEINGVCGWWIERNRDSLVDAMREAMGMDDGQRLAMGAKGHQLIEEKYTWPAIAEKMQEGYAAISH